MMNEEYLWYQEEIKQLNLARSEKERKINSLEKELEEQLKKNPTYIRLMETKRENESKNVITVERKVQELLNTHTSKELLSVTVSGGEISVNSRLIKYINKNQKSSEIYTFCDIFRDHYDFNRNTTTITGFKLLEGDSIDSLYNVMLNHSKKNQFFEFHDLKDFRKTLLFEVWMDYRGRSGMHNYFTRQTVAELLGWEK